MLTKTRCCVNHFSESVVATVTVSKVVKTSVHFINKGTKVDASYYRETLLQRCLVPEICQKSSDHFVFQQDGAPSRRAKSTVEFPQHTVPNCMAPTQQPGLEPSGLRCMGGSAAERVSHSDFQFGRSQEQSAHLLGES